MGRGFLPTVPFSDASSARASLFFLSGGGEGFQLQAHLVFRGAGLSLSGTTTTSVVVPACFSLRFTFELVVEEREESVGGDCARRRLRDRQTSLMSFSSNSRQRSMMLSRLSDQTTSTRSSRWKGVSQREKYKGERVR